MSILTRQHTIVTSHGSLPVEESGQGRIPVLLIHGNSSCRGVFRHQLKGRLAENHRLIVEGSPVPLAVVNGGADRIVNLDYFDTVAYGNLWEGRCHRLAGLGHAPFWEAPGDFDPVLERFLRDVETGRAATRFL